MSGYGGRRFGLTPCCMERRVGWGDGEPKRGLSASRPPKRSAFTETEAVVSRPGRLEPDWVVESARNAFWIGHLTDFAVGARAAHITREDREPMRSSRAAPPEGRLTRRMPVRTGSPAPVHDPNFACPAGYSTCRHTPCSCVHLLYPVRIFVVAGNWGGQSQTNQCGADFLLGDASSENGEGETRVQAPVSIRQD